MTNITLEPAELAFLLALLDAQSIPGADAEPLVPADKAARQVVLDQGQAALQQHGLIRVADGHFDGLGTPLLLAVAVLAAPAQVIRTTRYRDTGEQRIGHYVADDLIVEFFRTASGYRLVALDSLGTAVARLASWLPLNGSGPAAPAALSLPADAMEHLLESAQAGEAEQVAGLLEATANGNRDRLQAALADLRPVADVELATVANGEISPQQLITLFAAAGGAGMVHFTGTGQADLVVPAGPAFGSTLHAAATSLGE